MAHIHTQPGQIDHVADVFIVDTENKTVLLRIHDKHKMWLAVGGHIELNETGEEAALREVEEEVGLDVVLWDEYKKDTGMPKEEDRQSVLPPYHMNIHAINENHKHLAHIYYARALHTNIVEQEGEKSGGLKWWTKEQLETSQEVAPQIKWCALDALKNLCF